MIRQGVTSQPEGKANEAQGCDKSLVELGRNESPLPPLSSAATVDSLGRQDCRAV